MKIYTEIIWSWDDDKGELVQESSKFYDYDGPLTLANGSEQVNAATYLEYPSTIGEAKGVNNWISFNAFDFKSRNHHLNVALYIPGDALNTSYKSDYETTSLGLVGGNAEAAIAAYTPGEEGGGAKGIATFLKSLTAGMKSEGSAVAMLKFGEASNKAITGMKQIMEKKVGAVLNPYLVAAYKGPTDMRTHDFTFQMLPQDINESKACMRIATAFKSAMLPSHGGGNNATSPSMLFGYPDEFTIDFFVNGQIMPESDSNPMYRIGRSVLTGCELDFATESVALFFDKTQYPVSISMKLTFMEIEVMTREKVEKGF